MLKSASAHQSVSSLSHRTYLLGYRIILPFGLRPFLGAMLQAGHNLDCLMLRYEGVDWQDRSKWRCGAMVAPHQEGTYDGTSLNPLEVRHEYSRLD